MTPLQYFAGCCMMMTSVWLAMQASIVRGDYGWRARPWYRRAAMAVVAAILLTRGLTVVSHGVALNVIGIGLSIAMCVWQFLELVGCVTLAWRERAQKAEADALMASAFPGALQPPPYTERDVRPIR